MTPWIAARQASLSITNSGIQIILSRKSVHSCLILWPYGPHRTRPPCLSPIHGVYPISCPLSRWCHPTISSVVPFSSCLQSFPASGSFQISQLFTSDGQSIGVSALTSVLPMNTQDWSPLGWTGWISLQSKRLSRVFSNTTVQKHQILLHSAFSIVQLSHSHMTNGKTIALTRWTFVGKVASLFFNMLSRLVITFLPRSKCLLMSFNFMAGVTICSDFGVPKNKFSHFFPIYLPWIDETRCHDLSFLNAEL